MFRISINSTCRRWVQNMLVFMICLLIIGSPILKPILTAQVYLMTLFGICSTLLASHVLNPRHACTVELNLLARVIFLGGCLLAGTAASIMAEKFTHDHASLVNLATSTFLASVIALAFILVAKSLIDDRTLFLSILKYLFVIVLTYIILELGIRNNLIQGNMKAFYELMINANAASELDANAFGMKRFLGPFGFHPSTTVCFMVITGIILDRLEQSMLYRSCAVTISLFSFSGTSYLFAIGAILSLGIEIMKLQRSSKMLQRSALATIFMIAVLGSYLAKDKISALYVGMISSLKVTQALSYITVAPSLTELISGVSSNTTKFEVVGHFPEFRSFGSTDFGLMFIMVSSGLVGIFYLSARILILIGLLKAAAASRADTIIIGAIFIVTNFHYSLFNVINASLALTLGIGSAYCVWKIDEARSTVQPPVLEIETKTLFKAITSHDQR